MKTYLFVSAMLMLFTGTRADAASIAAQCESDLESLPGFLLENDRIT